MTRVMPSVSGMAGVRLWGLGLLCSVGTAVQAGWNFDANAPVVIYEHAGLQGRSAAVQGPVANLSQIDFNDRVSSVEIRRGQWQLCEHADFRGKCITLGPGRHALEGYFNDMASSIRPMDNAGAGWNSGPAGSLTLYEHGGGQGRALQVNGPVNDLSTQGFNDTASSVEIYQGNWQFCEHAGFQGRCFVLGPGRHSLEADFNDQLSSVRPTNERPGSGAWGGTGNAGSAPLLVYEHANFDGRLLPVSGAMTDLSAQGFNDTISSVEIRQGQWQFCEHANFGGQCMVLGPGRHRLDGWFNDQVSSIRPAGGAVGTYGTGGSGSVTLFEHSDFRGRTLPVTGQLEDLSRQGFNDTASSVDIKDGQWEFCTDANFGGYCAVFGPGRHVLSGPLQDSISSVRPRGASAQQGQRRGNNGQYDITF